MVYRVLHGGVWIIESSNNRDHHYRAAKWQSMQSVVVVVGEKRQNVREKNFIACSFDKIYPR